MAQRVVEHVRHHPLQQARICQHRGQPLVDRDLDRVRRVHSGQGVRDDLVVAHRAQGGRTAPVASRDESSRLSISPASRSADSSMAASSSRGVLVGQFEIGGAQAADRRLDRRQRRAQVVPDRGQQRRAQLGRLGLALGARRGGGRPLLAQGQQRLPGDGLQHPPVGAPATPARAASGARRRVDGDVDVGLVRVRRTGAAPTLATRTPVAVLLLQQRHRRQPRSSRATFSSSRSIGFGAVSTVRA